MDNKNKVLALILLLGELAALVGDRMVSRVPIGAPSNVVVKECEVPKLSRGEVFINVRACGACPTDLHHVQGIRMYLPLGGGSYGLTGQEWAGEVVEVGEDVVVFLAGDRVVADHILPCGRCFFASRAD